MSDFIAPILAFQNMTTIASDYNCATILALCYALFSKACCQPCLINKRRGVNNKSLLIILSGFLSRYSAVKLCTNNQLINIIHTRQINVAIRYDNRPCAENDEIYLATEYLQAYCAANAANTYSQTNQTLFVTQFQARFEINDFKITSFTQEHYVLQATLAGQGIGLLSNILSSITVQQPWLLPMENLPKVTGYSYSLRLSRHAKNNHAARYFSKWVKKAMQSEASS